MLRFLGITLMLCVALQTRTNAEELDGEVVVVEYKDGSSVTIERAKTRVIAGQSFIGGQVISAKSSAGSPANTGSRMWIASSEITRIIEFDTKSKFTDGRVMPNQTKTATPDQGQGDQQHQEKVSVEWQGRWYPARILKTENGKSFIHYEGFGSNWDEWVTPNRIRTVNSDQGQGELQAQDNVMVEWNGMWFPAKVLKTENGKAFIHYDGYGSNWDEWVPPNRIKKK